MGILQITYTRIPLSKPDKYHIVLFKFYLKMGVQYGFELDFEWPIFSNITISEPHCHTKRLG